MGLSPSTAGTGSDFNFYLTGFSLFGKRMSQDVESLGPAKCELLYPFQVKFQAVLSFSEMINSLWQHKLGYF